MKRSRNANYVTLFRFDQRMSNGKLLTKQLKRDALLLKRDKTNNHTAYNLIKKTSKNPPPLTVSCVKDISCFVVCSRG